MPELPETETIARDLQSLVAGRGITAAKVLRSDVLRGTKARGLIRSVVGSSIVAVWRRAKTIVVELSGARYLLVTPRFTGSLTITPPDEYATVVFTLDDDRTLTYRDVRRLGTVALVDADGFSAFDQRLGVEPLSPLFTVDRLSGILRSSGIAVKKGLMEQKRIAGVGNIYANEVLWLAGVDPSRAGSSLGPDEIARIHEELVSLLQRAVAARGTTFRDYRDARNERGGFAQYLQAYGRGGEPCPRCGRHLIETHAIDGRSTVFCFRCQG